MSLQLLPVIQVAMTRDTRTALFCWENLSLHDAPNAPDLFKRWLTGGVQDLGEPAVTELLLDRLNAFLTVESRTGCWVGTWK